MAGLAALLTCPRRVRWSCCWKEGLAGVGSTWSWLTSLGGTASCRAGLAQLGFLLVVLASVVTGEGPEGLSWWALVSVEPVVDELV